MLYILECMICVFLALSDVPLNTTGKPVTINDMGVGFLAILVIIAIIWIVIDIIKFSINNKKINDIDYSNNNNKEKFWRNILYRFECFILLFLYLIYGKDLVMKTTNKRPSKNEIAFSIALWIYTALLIVSVILICI